MEDGSAAHISGGAKCGYSPQNRYPGTHDSGRSLRDSLLTRCHRWFLQKRNHGSHRTGTPSDGDTKSMQFSIHLRRCSVEAASSDIFSSGETTGPVRIWDQEETPSSNASSSTFAKVGLWFEGGRRKFVLHSCRQSWRSGYYDSMSVYPVECFLG
jgi:hypothetical protein